MKVFYLTAALLAACSSWLSAQPPVFFQPGIQDFPLRLTDTCFHIQPWTLVDSLYTDDKGMSKLVHLRLALPTAFTTLQRLYDLNFVPVGDSVFSYELLKKRSDVPAGYYRLRVAVPGYEVYQRCVYHPPREMRKAPCLYSLLDRPEEKRTVGSHHFPCLHKKGSLYTKYVAASSATSRYPTHALIVVGLHAAEEPAYPTATPILKQRLSALLDSLAIAAPFYKGCTAQVGVQVGHLSAQQRQEISAAIEAHPLLTVRSLAFNYVEEKLLRPGYVLVQCEQTNVYRKVGLALSPTLRHSPPAYTSFKQYLQQYGFSMVEMPAETSPSVPAVPLLHVLYTGVLNVESFNEALESLRVHPEVLDIRVQSYLYDLWQY